MQLATTGSAIVRNTSSCFTVWSNTLSNANLAAISVLFTTSSDLSVASSNAIRSFSFASAAGVVM